jgi:FAD:protein FMN transferase
MRKCELTRGPGVYPCGQSKRPIGRRTALRGLLAALFGLRGSSALAATPGLRSRWDPSMEVAITFQIGDPRSAAGRRPYVSVFVETPDGQTVRTIALWAQRQIAWLRQLRHWYRSEVDRQEAKGGNLVNTLTSPTRRPGSYTVVWDGRDNTEEYVEQGRYVVLIETIRQNAGNHIVRQELEFGAEGFRTEVDPYASISNVVIEYRRRAETV